MPPAPVLDQEHPFAGWQSLPLDVVDGLIGDEPGASLWLGAHFIGEGRQSPHLAQIRVNFDHRTYRHDLPAIYSNQPEQRDFLDQFLSLFESFFRETEADIAHLGHLFDPEAVPVAWLSWLANWLALDLDEKWSEAQKREAIATAFVQYAQRGTVRGLRESLRLYAGVEAHIEEPITQTDWWLLPEDEAPTETAVEGALLGFTTMLAPVEADGAVVGTTAVFDQAHLITQNEFGAPLFENLAHQFSVQLYRGQVQQPQDLQKVQAIIDAEKPAHTTYQLSVIEPQMRVGLQARLGIDTIVAGPTPATESKIHLVLGGRSPGQIGKQSRLGITTQL